MRPAYTAPAVIALCGGLSAGCAFVPKPNPRLDAVMALQAEAQADPQVVRRALPELRRAQEATEGAGSAWRSLDDPAVVDHLTYMARQRIAISHEAALQAALAGMQPYARR